LREENLASIEKVFVAGPDAHLRNIRMVAIDVQALEF
jgi:hypothetical protein